MDNQNQTDRAGILGNLILFVNIRLNWIQQQRSHRIVKDRKFHYLDQNFELCSASGNASVKAVHIRKLNPYVFSIPR